VEDSDQSDGDCAQFVWTRCPPNADSCNGTLIAMMLPHRHDLESYLSSSAEVMGSITAFTDEFIALPPHQRDINRLNDVYFMLGKRALLEFDRCHAHVARLNIRYIVAFQEYLDCQTGGHMDNADAFGRCGLRSCAERAAKLRAGADRLQASIYPLVCNRVLHGNQREAEFVSPLEKSGRILARFRQLIGGMGAADVYATLQTLSPSSRDVPFVHRILFNIGWEEYMFPFTDVQPMSLPDIFDLTPRRFNPQFLPESALNMPFREPTATDWPFRGISLDLFSFPIETHPFVIADMFWNWFNRVAHIGLQFAVDAGIGADEANLGFDVMFSYYLAPIFAFEVSEILEVFSFAGAFLDSEEQATR
jgi:hypothetical protein